MKKIYQQPDTVVTRVELESPICAGSANFVGENEPSVNIQAQDVIDSDVNDFSGNAWGEINSSTGN